MSILKNTLVRKALSIPMHIGNTILGGNTIDKLREIQDPKVQRILRRAVKPKGFVNHSRIGKMIANTGHKKAMMTYGVERLKTHAARTVAGGAIATHALRTHRKKLKEAEDAQAALISSVMQQYNYQY